MNIPTLSQAPDAAATRLAFVMVKAFGDLTITASVLRRLAPDLRAACSLLIAPHLADLSLVLAPGCRIETLEIDKTLPPLFDLKLHGWPAIVASARQLRRALARAAPGTTLVFDRLSYRERFIAGRRRALPLGESLSANVYAAHEGFLERTLAGFSIAPHPEPVGRMLREGRVGMFPFSRVAAKNVPADLIARMAIQCRQHGLEPVVLLLEGEDFPALPDIACERIPRQFAALAAAIESVDAVICADSLPAHLSEYGGRPVYVAAPVANAYYMPPRVFAGKDWGLFSKPEELADRLNRFLRKLS